MIRPVSLTLRSLALLLILLLFSGVNAQNVVNGGFENVANNGWAFSNDGTGVGSGRAAGANGSNQFCSIASGVGHGVEYQGSISQTIPGFVVGHHYQVSFWYAGANAYANPVEVLLNGSNIILPYSAPSTNNWESKKTNTFLANATSYRLDFWGSHFDSRQHFQYYAAVLVDDIVVVDLDNPNSVSSVSLSVHSLQSGQSTIGTLTLAENAPAGGATVEIESTDPNVASVPASVLVPPGSNTASFQVDAKSVSGIVRIRATYNAYRTDVVTVTRGINNFVNPGYETPPIRSNSYGFGPADQFGWQINHAAGIANGTVFNINGPHDFHQAAFLQTLYGAGSVAQLVGGMIPGHHYQISFWMAQRQGTTIASLRVFVNGTPISNAQAPSSISWAQFTTPTFVVTQYANLLEFQTVNTGSDVLLDDAVLLDTDDPVKVSSVSFVHPVVNAGDPLTGTVTLNQPAPTGGTQVWLEVSDPTYLDIPLSVTVPEGQTSANFTVTGKPANNDVLLEVRATYNGSVVTDITDSHAVVLALSLASASTFGGGVVNGAVSIGGTAGQDTSVSLSSDNAAASAPSSVTVSAGQTAVSFQVTTVPVDADVTATITATLNSQTQTKQLLVRAAIVTSVVAPGGITGGTNSAASVHLSSKTGPSGVTVQLTSSSANLVVPATLQIPSGQTVGTFAITTSRVIAQETDTITATLGASSARTTVVLFPVRVASFAMQSYYVVGGNNPNATVSIDRAAPSGGVTLNISSDNPAASPPATVFIAQGTNFVTFPVPTSGVASEQIVHLTASSATNSVSTSPIHLYPVSQVLAVHLPLNIVGGNQFTGSVTLNGQSSGIDVSLSSNDPSVIVPSTVHVNAGVYSGSFNAISSSVAKSTLVTITATYGTSTKSGLMTILPAGLSALRAPLSVTGGNPFYGYLTLNGVSSGGAITLTSSDPAISVPATVQVNSGDHEVSFLATTKGVVFTLPVMITASYSGVTKSAVVSVLPAALQSATFTPDTITGGSTANLTLVLTGKILGGTVTFTSSSPGIVQVPESATLTPGYSYVFHFPTQKVFNPTTVTVSATYNFVTVTSTVTLTP